jgi:hypothetical protein
VPIISIFYEMAMDVTKIPLFLLVSHRPNNPRQVKQLSLLQALSQQQ